MGLKGFTRVWRWYEMGIEGFGGYGGTQMGVNELGWV